MLNRLAGVIFDNAVATNGNDHKFFHVVMSATEGDGVMTNARLPDALRLSGLQILAPLVGRIRRSRRIRQKQRALYRSDAVTFAPAKNGFLEAGEG